MRQERHMCQILLVDNNEPEAVVSAARLRRTGFAVRIARDGTEALRELFQCRPDLIVLELLLPGMDGYETCRLVRSICDVPILVLTAVSEEQSVIRSLDVGADQYLVKPVPATELVSRIQVLLRRARPSWPAPTVRMGDVEVDVERGVVTKRGELVSLTPTEFRLLSALSERAGRVCSHDQLLERVWGPEWADAVHHLRLYVGYLRRKLEDDPSNPRHILSEWGVGYRLVTDVDMSAQAALRNIS
jgi:two-component system KDP operon response regulator KdpE